MAKAKRFHPTRLLSKRGVLKIQVSFRVIFGKKNSLRSLFQTGQELWPKGCSLRFVNGDRLQDRDEIYVHSLAPGEQTNVSVNIRSPNISKIVRSQWRLFTSNGVPFGGEMIVN